MQVRTQNISGEQKLPHETQACSIRTLNASQSEESIFQRIASCCLFSVFADRSREESQEMLKRLFKGNASDFEMNIQESDNPLTLPFNPVEIEQYRALVSSVPFCPVNWTLAEILEFHIHKALSFFEKEGKISSKVIDQFCRNLSGAGLDRCAVFTSLKVSYRQFAEQLEQIIAILESSVTCNKKNRKKYELPYQNALNSLRLLIKIYDLRNPNGQLLRMQRCKAISQLKDDLPHRKKTPQETYQNLLDYMNFAESLLNHVVGLQKQVKDKSIDQFHRVKTAILTFQEEEDENLFDAAHVPLEQQETPALPLAFNAKEMQKQVLDIYREVKAYRERKQTVLGVHQPDSNVLKVLITDSNHHCMRIELVAFQQYETIVHLFEKILSLLDIYLGESIEEHASIFTRIVRALASKTIVFNQVSRLEKLQPIFAGLVDPRFAISTGEGRALYSSQMTDKIAQKLQTHAIHFLSPEEKGLFIQQCGNFVTHLLQIFYPKAEFVEHLYQVEEQEGGWIQPDPSLIVKDATLYPLVSQFLEELYAKLQKLYKIHTDSFIKLVSSLNKETCQKHAVGLRLFFEELVFEEMMPFCMLYLLHQELHFLTQPKTVKEPPSLLETPIGQYLIMKELEYAFYEIEQTITEAQKPTTEEEGSCTLHIQPSAQEKTPAQDLTNTPFFPKKTAPIAPTPWAPMKTPRPLQASKQTLEEKLANLPTNFLRYIQNKERKLMKALKENLGVVTLLRQAGSHATLNIGGRKITMTLKGGGSSKSHTVIRGVTRQCFKEK